MKKVDCFWEKRNLGEKVVEFVVEDSDYYDNLIFEDKIEDYDYQVVKVPVNKIDFNLGLSKLGFSLMELQMDMSVNPKHFNYELKQIKWISSFVRLTEVHNQSELDEILERIKPQMFNTDRISLDPYYGMEKGCSRYKHWVQDEFDKQTAGFIKIEYNDIHIGFVMYKIGSEIRGLLGGIYHNYQNMGLGILTPCTLPLFVKMKQLPVNKIVGNISSNNRPVWELYEALGYKVTNPHYVFIRHQKKEEKSI